MLKTISRTTLMPNNVLKSIHTSSIVRLKEIYAKKQDEKTTIIGAKQIKSPRIPFLLKLDPNSKKCPLCQLGLDLKYTDVLILNQYIDSEGKVFPQFATKLCKDQYKLVKNLIYMAQYAGLLPQPPRDYVKPYHSLNTYYDEKTIVLHPKKREFDTRLLGLKLGTTEKLRVKPEEGVYMGLRYR